MCGRYAVTLPPEAMAQLFGSSDRPNLAPRYNVAPTQTVPAVALGKTGERRIIQARWGLRPNWMKTDPKTGPLFNARSETAADKPSFRSAFRRKRCLIPADGFFEWQRRDKERIPHFIGRPDGAPVAFAGLWEYAPDLELEPHLSVTILTKAALPRFEDLHARFPVVLPETSWTAWLDRDTAAPALNDLIAHDDAALMEAWRVSDYVNRVANDDPKTLERLPTTDH